MLPTGIETLCNFLRGVRTLREQEPALASRLRIHFVGSSNQTAQDATPRVLPHAQSLGVADLVNEVAPRVPYLQALRILTQASAVLLLGSSERHYTASKLYPALLAQRPLLAMYHEASTVSSILPSVVRPPSGARHYLRR